MNFFLISYIGDYIANDICVIAFGYRIVKFIIFIFWFL